jgi:Glyoxalase-like domain
VGLRPDTLTFDCTDPVRVATFWAGATGFKLADRDPQGSFVKDQSGRTAGLFFQPVPEAKGAKNRVHLDLRPEDTMAEEVARLQMLGARELSFVQERNAFWTVMADAEGNEFCVLRGPDEGSERTTPGIDSMVIDSDDWKRVANFWIEALGYREHAIGENGIEIVSERDGDPMLSFVHVPEPKTVKNRIHLDTRPDTSMANEVRRMKAIGAREFAYVSEGDIFWTVMKDVEGNEFCVLRGPEDGWTPNEL